MKFDEGDHGSAGVAPVWRIVAVLAGAAAAVLLLLTMVLASVLWSDRERLRELEQVRSGAPNAAFFPQPGIGLGGQPDDDEPENPPYPLVADLHPATPPAIPGEEPMEVPGRTTSGRFLALGAEPWTIPEGKALQQASVSPDGQCLAAVSGSQELLMLPLTPQGLPDPAEPEQPPGGLAAGNPAESDQVVGVPSWSSDGQWAYIADVTGRLRRYHRERVTAEVLPLSGDSPVGLGVAKVIFRRFRAAPKADLGGDSNAPDPCEVVLADLETNQVRVLLPASPKRWRPQSVSPDGKQLALIGEQRDDKGTHHARLFLFDLAAERPGEPRPVGQPGPQVGPVSSANDSRSFVYARSTVPHPPDHWEANGGYPRLELYHLDLGSGKETRISRGGVVAALSPSPGDELHYLAWRPGPDGFPITVLRRVRRLDAYAFGEREPDRPIRDSRAWTRLCDQVLAKVNVAPDASGGQLASEVLTHLAEEFGHAYRERFHAEAPATPLQWARQLDELQALDFRPDVRGPVRLVIGAAWGEYLRRQHGATWQLTAGPLVPQAANGAAGPESPFGIVFNPFAEAGLAVSFADDREGNSAPASVATILARADGRMLVLSNATGLAKLVPADPALDMAAKLFEQGKPEEAEKALLDLLQQEHHARNRYLLRHVCQLLYRHDRKQALRQVLEPRVEAPPADPHLYNLLGLALLDADPAAAAQQFRNALRADLSYGPGYLNLALAYEKADDRDSAILTLRRYLKLQGDGAYADDARQRLAAFETGAAAGTGGVAPRVEPAESREP